MADENLNRNIVRALVRRRPEVDVALAQDVGLTGSPDAFMLQWASSHGRLVVSHDFRTLAAAAEERSRNGDPMSGVLLVPRQMPVSAAVDDLLLILECSDVEEWNGMIQYLPL